MTEDFEYVQLTRDCAKKHAEALAALGRDNPWENWRAENILMELPDKWRLSVLVLLSKSPVAYAIVSRNPGAMHIHHFIVAAPWRGKAIGRNMLLRIAATCASEGAPRMTLKVHKVNVAAISFYQRWGFRVTGEKGPDLLEMSGNPQAALAILRAAHP